MIAIPVVLLLLFVFGIAIIDGCSYLLSQKRVVNIKLRAAIDFLILAGLPLLFFGIAKDLFGGGILHPIPPQYEYVLHILVAIVVVGYFCCYFNFIYELPELVGLITLILLLGILVNIMIALNSFHDLSLFALFNGLIILLLVNKLIEIHINKVEYEKSN